MYSWLDRKHFETGGVIQLAGNVKLHVEPITTRGQSDQVIASLMSLIERGILKEGDVLPPERELAKQFNVGRNALREAIKVLEIYGLVGRKTKVGTVIRQTNLDYIISFAFSDLPATTRVFNEIQSFRLVIETGIANAVLAHINDKVIARLKELIEMMGATDDYRQQALCDYEFHLTLVRLSQNGIITRMYEVLSEPMKRLMELGKGKQGGAFAQRIHRELVSALEVRDLEKYVALMRRHLNKGRRFLAKEQQAIDRVVSGGGSRLPRREWSAGTDSSFRHKKSD